jgi:hypothetical protein
MRVDVAEGQRIARVADQATVRDAWSPAGRS